MCHNDNQKWIVSLATAFLFWLLVLLLFPIAQALHELRQSEQLQIQGEMGRAAQLRYHASQGLFWRRNDLIEQAAQLALLANQPHFCVEILRPFYINRQLSQSSQFILSQAYSKMGYDGMANQIRLELAEAGYIPLILYPLVLEQAQNGQQITRTHEVLDHLMVLQPHNSLWQYRSALMQMTTQPNEARKTLQTIAASDPAYQDKIKILLNPLEEAPNPDLTYALLQAGRGLASIGEWTLAELAFEKAVGLRPDYAEAWAYLGLAKFHESYLERTPASLKIVDSNDPFEDGEHHHPYYVLRKNTGLAEIRHALYLNPTSQVALAFETQYWLENGYPQLALESAQLAARIYPKDRVVQEQYAQVLEQNGDLKSAWQIYQQLLLTATDKKASIIALLRFEIQNQFQLWEEALPLARTLTYQKPNDVACLDLLAQVLMEINYNERAREILERAINLDPDYPAAHLHLAQIYLLQGNLKQAIRELNTTIQLDPQNPAATQARRLLENYAH